MKDIARTKKQLIAEMADLRRRIAELESLNATFGEPGEGLREIEMRYRFISENVGDFIWQLDKDLRFTYMSPSVRRLGFEPDEMVGKHLFSFLTPEGAATAQRLQARRQSLVERGISEDSTTVELEFVGRNGSLLPVEVKISPYFDGDGNLLSYQGVTRDITQRKLAEEALRESEEKFRLLFEKSADPILLMDEEVCVDCNEAACMLLGAAGKEHLVGARQHEFSPERQPDGSVSREKAGALRRLAVKRGVNHFEWMCRNLRGEEFWVEVSQTVIPFSGKPILYTVWKDIRERKRAESELRDSEERYRVAIENSNEGVALVRGDRLIYVNRRLLDIFGYDKQEDVLGKTVFFAVHPQDTEMIEQYNRSRHSGRPVPSRYEFRGIRKDGGTVFMEAAVTAITYAGQPALLVHLRDVTDHRVAEEERVRLESQLLQAQKMEAVGQLAGGISHDFNNILMVIIGFGTILKMRMNQNDPLASYVDQILSSSEKAANLTKSLLAFSRKQQINLTPTDINDIVRSTGKFLERLLTEDIELEIRLSDSRFIAMADMIQMDQVLINLATNARDAMPKGGLLRIETGIATIDHDFRAAHGFGEPGKYALIAVSDSGVGMDEATREHIFEPFFTTKEAGKGTGLGLSMVYGIVKQHGGYVTVESEPDQGTVFRVCLPLVDGKQETPSLTAEEPKDGFETVLVAEDDPAVRRLTMEVLQAHGYTPIEAVDGEDAVRVFKENEKRIDLVMLDVVMPKKNGTEAYDEIKRIDSGVKVLFVSGYAGEIINDKGFFDGGANFVSKPLSPPVLLAKVREILDS